MICPVCKANGELSTVTPGSSRSTLMAYDPGYYDTGGKWVKNPDPNTHTTDYRCSKGHRFTVKRREGVADVTTVAPP